MTRLIQRTVRVSSATWTDVPEASVRVMQVSGVTKEAHLFTDAVSGVTWLVLPSSMGTSWAVRGL